MTHIIVGAIGIASTKAGPSGATIPGAVAEADTRIANTVGRFTENPAWCANSQTARSCLLVILETHCFVQFSSGCYQPCLPGLATASNRPCTAAVRNRAHDGSQQSTHCTARHCNLACGAILTAHLLRCAATERSGRIVPLPHDGVRRPYRGQRAIAETKNGGTRRAYLIHRWRLVLGLA
jgi:hypothetical protein